jgi:prephenate dehydratase
MRLHYLGPAGTFTEQAAQRLARRAGIDAAFEPAASIQSAFEALRRDAAAAAVVPYYNHLEGLIQETIDGVFESGVPIVAAERLPITFAIGRHRDPGDVEVIYSHPKGLAQCSDYVTARHPGAKTVPLTSTAEAARRAATEPGALAIARREAIEAAGLVVVADDIGNRTHGRQNYTEFLLLGRHRASVPGDAPCRTMLAVMPYEDRVGLLADILNQFAFYRINLAKIHSRPGVIRGNTARDPQMFYFEVTCRDDSPDFLACSSAINYRFGVRGQAPPLLSLGCYPLHEEPGAAS